MTTWTKMVAVSWKEVDNLRELIALGDQHKAESKIKKVSWIIPNTKR